ncbi:hypothetical protein CEXT_700701 [Caerostris extrusa]|uniref:C2H2-type domain-containing protein n=1 Tax=Caerostris extrusa TaxID=172846 RepID=A0AAV4PZN8_CAEEX|nr:hypothetical protein CEXT_700701 [Caerostris extrusa]
MVLNVIEWLKAKLCGCCASLESEEQFESRLFVCEGCGHISLSEKGLRQHKLLVHKEGRMLERTLDANGRPLNYFGDLPVLPPKPLKAVEDQKLGRRRPIVSVLLSGFFDSNDEDEDHLTKPPF